MPGLVAVRRRGRPRPMRKLRFDDATVRTRRVSCGSTPLRS
jgi:hypothetical protein